MSNPDITMKERLDIYIKSYTKITKMAGLVQFWTRLASTGVIAIMIRDILLGKAIINSVKLATTDYSDDIRFLPTKEWIDAFTAMQTRNALQAAGLIFIANKAKSKKDLFQAYATGFKTAKEYEDKLSVLKITLYDAKSKFTRMLDQQKSMSKKEIELVENLLIAIDRDIENTDKELKSIKTMKATGESGSFLKKLFNKDIRESTRISNLITEDDRVDVSKLTDKEALVLLNTVLLKYKDSMKTTTKNFSYTRILTPFIVGVSSIVPAVGIGYLINAAVRPREDIRLNIYLRKLEKASLADPKLSKNASLVTKAIIVKLKKQHNNATETERKEINAIVEYLTEILEVIQL